MPETTKAKSSKNAIIRPKFLSVISFIAINLVLPLVVKANTVAPVSPKVLPNLMDQLWWDYPMRNGWGKSHRGAKKTACMDFERTP
jgi:hypothetical protein